MRKVYIKLDVKLIINADDEVSINEIISEMDYSFISDTDDAEIEDAEIVGYEVVDSK